MLQHAIGHARLMRESTDRVQAALNSGDVKEQLVARRILENPSAWEQWEREHSNLMRQVAAHSAMPAQVASLKRTSLGLLHGKALFQYLREGEVRGSRRKAVLAYFRPGRSYEHAVIAEHSQYLRKACSLLCANHVGSDLVRDPAFLDPMQRYEELYTEYFDLYCTTLIGGPGGKLESRQSLLPLLKHQLNEWRAAILDPKRAQPFIRLDAELRRRTGDTQRLRSLGPASKRRR
jgi:hypothetical protein